MTEDYLQRYVVLVGKFLVGSCYHLLFKKERMNDLDWEFIWICKLQERLQLFFMRILVRNLLIRKVVDDRVGFEEINYVL